MDLAGLRVLVTGAAGFVGANLVRELLSAGALVHGIVRPTTNPWRLQGLASRLQLHAIDLCDAPAVSAAVATSAPDVVFHLAKHRGDPSRLGYRPAYRANLDATLNLAEAAMSRPLLKFVQAGSSLEYDLTRSPLREDDAPAPSTVHGVTKAAATLLCQHLARRHGLPAVVLRLFTVYGPWEPASRFVPSVVRAALEGGSLCLTRPGLRHDWVFVGDVVDACVRSVWAPVEGQIINVGTGHESTNEAVVQAVEEICGCRIRRRDDSLPARPWDQPHWVADVTKAGQLLGWCASHDLRGGLERTVSWFRQHGHAYGAAADA